ncbi:MAG TPA: HD domain-containing phosphohydrolase [Novimethylophilus sp.]|uniref:HD-GYP domain-containing protein n=1 Tax=Novimethylophilus sp. TaxID=2137426 RepID=UPI002F3EE0DA
MKMKSHYIHPDQLCVGLYIHLDLGWMGHPFTFSNFKIKDEGQIEKIRALKLKQLRYDPLRSDCEPLLPPTVPAAWAPMKVAVPVSPALDLQKRSNRLKQLNDIILSCERKFVVDAHRVRAVTRNLSAHPASAREEAELLVNQMVKSALTESDVVLHAVGSNHSQQENYVHSLNVTVLALMLAKALDMSDEDARELGLAAIFHDIGKAESPLNKSFIDMHCELGSRLALQSGMSERIARIILQHHEYVDGSGYPKHLKEAQIDPLARLLGIVNDYENLCNPANPADAMTPYEALSHMYVTQPQKFDSTILRLLIKSLGVYPPGSIVQLSNGVYGIVMTVNPQKPLLPFVMIHEPKVSRETPVVIDLSEEVGLSIKKCLRPLQLPQDAFEYLRPRKRICYYFLNKQPTDGAPLDMTDVIAGQQFRTGTDPFPV